MFKFNKFLFFTIMIIPAYASALDVVLSDGLNDVVTIDNTILHINCKKVTSDKFIDSTIKEIQFFNSSYKPLTIKNNLSKIVLCKKLSINGKKWFRGTYNLNKKIIYLELSNLQDAEYALHHEFSSILLKNSKKLSNIKLNWIKYNNKPYVNYWTQKSKSMWNSKNKKLRSNGFLYPYCKTNFENDFNVISAFYKSSYLKSTIDKASKKYRLINKKYNIVKNFYEGL